MLISNSDMQWVLLSDWYCSQLGYFMICWVWSCWAPLGTNSDPGWRDLWIRKCQPWYELALDPCAQINAIAICMFWRIWKLLDLSRLFELVFRYY